MCHRSHMDSAADPFDLKRFVDAQEPVYADVVDELRAGRKRRHWMWFVFPQLRGLGGSAMADRYGISSLPEARAYLRHELLGPRLHECARLVERVQGRSVGQIFGSPDDLKLCSSMTLFAHATDDNADFLAVLQKYYDGRQDPVTLARLADS
ncbi:calpastatin [Mycobacterium avium 10-5560]|nr:calpastatin [Mycobacterium avium 10-5560]